MYIQSLYIKNFKAISELFIENTTQIVTLIKGDNGSGKSSVVIALTYILTDYLPEKLEEFVKWGKNNFHLKCVFYHDGKDYEYIIDYSRKNKKTQKELTIKGDPASPYLNSDAVAKMKEIINPELALYSSVSQQGESTQILFEKPTRQLEKLREIMGLDSIIDVCQLMEDDIKEFKETISNLTTEINTLSQITYSVMEVPELDDICELSKEYEELKKQKEVYDKQYKLYLEYEQQYNRYEDAQKEKISIDNEIKLYENEIQELKPKEQVPYNPDYHNKLINEQSKIQLQATQYNSELQHYNEYNKHKHEIETRINSLQNEIDSIEINEITPIHITEKSLHADEQKIIQLKATLNNLYKEKELTTAGKCSQCGKVYHGDIKKITTNIAATNEGVRKLSEKQESDKAIIADYIELVQTQKQNIILRSKLEEQKQSLIDHLKKMITAKKPEKQNFSTILKDLEQKVAQQEILKSQFDEVEKFNTTVQANSITTKSKIDVLQKESMRLGLISIPNVIVKPTPFDEDTFTSIQQQIVIYETKKNVKERIEKYNTDLLLKKAHTDEQITEKKARLDSLRFEIKKTQDAKKILEKNFSAYMIEKGTEYIKYMMNDFFSKTYGKYEILLKQKGKSVRFFYTADGDHYTPVSMSSGFERQLLAISFRLALCSLQNHNILILDEIDSDASVNNSLRLFSNLLNLQTFKQIYCITQIPETQEMLINNYNTQEININSAA